MSKFKKCKVVMLSTNEKANIGADNWYLPNTKTLIINNVKSHLYILSNEEIKEGDWYYLPRTNFIYQCKEDPTELNLERRVGVRKIIATTDKLNIHPNIADSYRSANCLPQPSQSFIEVFVREYNKGNIITEVMVEYTDEVWGNAKLIIPSKPKINLKDNTITICKVKDSWNREEVKHLSECAWNGGAFWGSSKPNSHYFDKWIEENL